MSTFHRVRPILRLNRSSTADVLQRAYAVYQGLSSAERFPDPSPSPGEIKDQTEALEQAEKNVKTGIKGATAIRNAARSKLVSTLDGARAYVQKLCDVASPPDATVLAQSAGMFVAAQPLPYKPILAVTPGPTSGSAALDANAGMLLGGRKGRVRVFHWQWTADGGKAFHDATATPFAKTVITDLPPLSTIGFRVRVAVAGGLGDWSQVVSVLIP